MFTQGRVKKKMASNGRKMLEEHIHNFVINLNPTDDEIKEGKEIMDKMFRLLQSCSTYSRGFSINRTVLYGGTAKKTSIRGCLDFDCAVIVNSSNNQLTIPKVLESFQDTLMMAEHWNLEEKDFNAAPKHDPKTLMFSINGIGFDIGAYIDTDVSMVETNVKFAKEKSAFAHEIARLAKFWNKTLILELMKDYQKISGRSSIMELVGFAAAEEEEKTNPGRINHLKAFRIFLVKIRDINNIKILHEDFWRRNGIYYKGTSAPCYIIDPSDARGQLFRKSE